jgi:pimeloyl-ACP methyl ester carboxylesterase
MAREPFTVTVAGGDLVGWVDGSGPNVLLLHGGPGLSADYLDGLIPELVPGYRVAVYQQRGLSPSTEEGPFTVAAHLADVAAVLKGLRWDKAFVAGHSWGGYLATHVAVALPGRLHGVLCIDPIGGVGDGGVEAFEAAMNARTPEANRARAKELDEQALQGEGTEQAALESLSLVWPAYFAHPGAAPPMPPVRLSVPSYAAGYESMVKELATLEPLLPSIKVPVGFVLGAESPIPPDQAGRATADRIPNAWVEIIPDAGHFLWLETPGVVRTALDRLVRSASIVAGRRPEPS